MRKLLLAAFLVPAALAAFPPAAARAGDDPPAAQEPPKNAANDAAAKWIEELKGKMAKLSEADAKASIARLVEIWKDKDVLPETKKAVPDLLEKYAKGGELAVMVAAIEAMPELGAEPGGKSIRDVLEHELKAKTPSVDVYGVCLRGLKKLADPSKATIALLADLLKRKENDIVGKAADAMSGYKDAPGKVRKELMEEVLKTGESAFQASRDGKDSTAVARWNAIQSGVMAALQALSGQEFSDPTKARAWFNDHKKDAKIWS